MSRFFPLSALLRLRKLEQDAAVAKLVDADSRRRETIVRRARSMGALADTPVDAFDADSMFAIAASRAASRSMLEALEVRLVGEERAAADAAEVVREAHQRSQSLEKLAERHAAAQRAEDLRREQVALDELTGSARLRGGAGAGAGDGESDGSGR